MYDEDDDMEYEYEYDSAEYEDDFYEWLDSQEEYPDTEFARKILDKMKDDQLYDCFNEYFDGEDECIWSMKDFNTQMDEAWRADQIENLKSKHLHFDPNEKYISWKYGTTNDKMKYVDKEALFDRISETGEDIRGFYEYALDHGLIDLRNGPWNEDYDDSQDEIASVKYVAQPDALKDMVVVHTGFPNSKENQIDDLVTSLGGIIKSSVVLKTNILIYNPDYDHETVKLKRAKELNASGKNISILTLDEFIKGIRENTISNL